MSDDGPDYDAVVPEKLRLKGVSLKKHKKSKKRKDKKGRRREKRARVEEDDGDAAAAPNGEAAEKKLATGEGEEEDEEHEEPEDTRTEAEKRFEEVQRKRMRRTVQQMAAKTHRQKVDEFNEYLGRLSEHHDIPKVASAGNGRVIGGTVLRHGKTVI